MTLSPTSTIPTSPEINSFMAFLNIAQNTVDPVKRTTCKILHLVKTMTLRYGLDHFLGQSINIILHLFGREKKSCYRKNCFRYDCKNSWKLPLYSIMYLILKRILYWFTVLCPWSCMSLKCPQPYSWGWPEKIAWTRLVFQVRSDWKQS